MQKNDKFYTFLFKHSTKNRIQIRKVEVPRQAAHLFSIGAFLLAGIAFLGVGVSGMIRSNVLAKAVDTNTVLSQATLAAPQEKAIDYSRPGDSQDTSANSGGPELGSEDDSEDSAIDNQLRAIALTMEPTLRPAQWPKEGKINNEFGFRRNPFGGRAYEFHPGMDIDGERGESILAPSAGTVVKAGYNGGYGNLVEIDHGNGITTRYGHMSKVEVSVGDTVTRGQLLGLVGSTGRSTGPHLHYEIRLNDRPVNPRHFLPQESPTINK